MATRSRPEKEKVAFPRRGDIYLVHFDPTVGHEIQKTRPAVIIQNDVSNQYSPITIVAAISSQAAATPGEYANARSRWWEIETGADRLAARLA